MQWSPERAIQGKLFVLFGIQQLDNLDFIKLCTYTECQLGSIFTFLGFNKYRGHPIERLNYLDDLRRCTWIDKTEEKSLDAPTDAQNSQDKCESGSATENHKHRQKKMATSQGVANLSHCTKNSHTESDFGSDGLSEREKTCITDNLLASNFDISEDSLS